MKETRATTASGLARLPARAFTWRAKVCLFFVQLGSRTFVIESRPQSPNISFFRGNQIALSKMPEQFSWKIKAEKMSAEIIFSGKFY